MGNWQGDYRDIKRVVRMLVGITIGVALFGCHLDVSSASGSPQLIVAADISPTRPQPTVEASLSSSVIDPPTVTAKFMPTVRPTGRPDRPPPEAGLIRHGDRSLPYLALTFDAGENAEYPAGYDEAIIDILTGTRTPATLFLGGLWMQRHPGRTRALAANPLFELGNHAWSHPDFTRLNPEAMQLEILRTQEIMLKLTGRQATLFRFPFGAYTDEALTVVSQNSLQAIQWDVVSGDPDPRISTRAIIHHLTTQVENGSIIVLHLNGRGWHTAEALPTVINRLRDRGYTFVTVSQLLAGD